MITCIGLMLSRPCAGCKAAMGWGGGVIGTVGQLGLTLRHARSAEFIPQGQSGSQTESFDFRMFAALYPSCGNKFRAPDRQFQSHPHITVEPLVKLLKSLRFKYDSPTAVPRLNGGVHGPRDLARRSVGVVLRVVLSGRRLHTGAEGNVSPGWPGLRFDA